MCNCFKPTRQRGAFEELSYNERSMILLQGDDAGCTSYSGEFTGTHFYVAGAGTEHERMFLRQARREAINYCAEHGVKLSQLINARSFCEARVLALTGS